jgi:anti-sigma factor ChrR (cupin superfamily)
MRLHADFTRRASVATDQYQWVTSPQGGVERVMLDRLGDEKARATSLVRYAPDAQFPSHEHPGGEEILVLSGTFSDEDGDYPAGWYLRNPPGSSHRPYSREGATLFVKLWQMPASEARRVRLDTRDPANWQREGDREVCPLFSSEAERVSLQRLAPGDGLFNEAEAGAELLVLAGELTVAGKDYPTGSWLRLPAGDHPPSSAGAQGATLYLKTGHLAGMTPEV